MTIRSATDSSILCVVGNFDVTGQTSAFTFPVAGTWYDYLNGGTITASTGAQNISLQPGEFHVYLNRNLVNAVTTPVSNTIATGSQLTAFVYPNPAQSASVLNIELPQSGKVQVDLLNTIGQKMATIFNGNLSRGKHSLPLTDKINNLPAGTWILNIQAAGKTAPVKMVIQ